MARQMSTPVIPFHPIGLSEVFTSSFEIYRRRPRTFIGLAVLPAIFFAVVFTVLFAFGLVMFIPLITSIGAYDTAPSVNTPLMISFLVGSFIGINLCWVVSIWSVLLLSVATVQVDRGGAPTMGSVMRDAKGSFARSAGAVGLIMIMAIIGYAILGAIVALSIYLESGWPMAIAVLLVLALFGLQFVFIARFGLVAQVMAIESLGPVSALQRSWQITRGQGLRVLGYTIAVSLIISAASSIIQLLTNFMTSISSNLATIQIPPSATATLQSQIDLAAIIPLIGIVGLAVFINCAFQVLIIPFQTIFTTTLYTDVRRRYEGMNGTPSF